MPGATLTLGNDATGIAVTGQSGENGRYLFNQIDPGIYTITTQQRGFKTVVQKNVRVYQRGGGAESGGQKGRHRCGLDGSADVIAAIKAGDVKATVLQPAAHISRMAVEQADQFIKAGASKPENRRLIAN